MYRAITMKIVACGLWVGWCAYPCQLIPTGPAAADLCRRMYGDSVDSIEKFLRCEVTVNCYDSEDGYTPLASALLRSKEKESEVVVALLLKRGAHPKALSPIHSPGINPLAIAVHREHLGNCKRLLAAKADPSAVWLAGEYSVLKAIKDKEQTYKKVLPKEILDDKGDVQEWAYEKPKETDGFQEVASSIEAAVKEKLQRYENAKNIRMLLEKAGASEK